MRTPSPCGTCQCVHLARLRREAGEGILGAQPRFDGVACEADSACASGSGSPRATRSCHSTRSSPVMASVTGCSTCSRVFISRKWNAPSGVSRNSTVPAPT